VTLCWSQSDLENFHALFEPTDNEIKNWFPEGAKIPHSFTNDPLKRNLESSIVKSLRTNLLLSLPEFMVPSVFIPLDSLPLTPNGKLDKRALPRPGNKSFNKQYIAPSSDLEETICRIFSNVTGTDPVSAEDNFFAIGGHSLLVMRVIADLEKEIGLLLPIRTMFDFSTPKSSAQEIIKGIKSEYQPILPLNTSGSATPIFAIHPAGGIGNVYKPISNYLGKDQPFYAIQARGLEVNEEPHQNIREMVESYLPAIKKIQPKGPYRLLGWSLGGNIAQDLAYHLEEAGEIVEQLILLDSFSGKVEEYASFGSDEDVIADSLKNTATNFGIESDHYSLDNVSLIEALRQKMIGESYISPETPTLLFKKLLKLMILARYQLAGHIPKKVNAPILLIRALEGIEPNIADQFNWAQFTNSSCVTEFIKAKHSNMCDEKSSGVICSIMSKLNSTA
jgi:thioesterase domain-containing protein/acyl carrier protein